MRKEQFLNGEQFRVAGGTSGENRFVPLSSCNGEGYIEMGGVYLGNVSQISEKGFSWYSYALGERIGHFVLFSRCEVTNK